MQWSSICPVKAKVTFIMLIRPRYSQFILGIHVARNCSPWLRPWAWAMLIVFFPSLPTSSMITEAMVHWLGCLVLFFSMIPFTSPYYVDSWHSHHDHCWFYFFAPLSASSMITAAMVSWLLRFFCVSLCLFYFCVLWNLYAFSVITEAMVNCLVWFFPSLCINSTLCTECSGATNGTYCSLELPLSYEIWGGAVHGW